MTRDELYWRRSRTTTNLFLRSHDDTRSRAVVYQRPDGTFGWKGSGYDDGQSYPTEEESISAVYSALEM
jgi:hypothetical protein